MPNWTSNRILAKGNEPDLRKFLRSVASKDQVFDFNRIVPMPELLRHTASGSRIIDGKKVSSWYVINKDELFPADQDVRLFSAKEKAELERIGFDNWYDWSIANWGTKWNACHAEIVANCPAQGHVEISFETAWDAPNPIFQRMFEIFPRLSFTCTWQHECEEGIHSLTRPSVQS
jgi:hypothetical protein